MRITQADPDSVELVAVCMRESDFREFSALSFADTREELAADLARRFGRHPDVLTIWHGPDPVAVGGLILTRPNVCTILFFGTDDFPKVGAALTRFINDKLIPNAKEAGVHRLECVVKSDNWPARRWIGFFGLTHEAPLPSYGRGREDFEQFAWVADAG